MGQRASIGEDVAAQAAAGQAKHSIASLQVSDALSSCNNDASAVAARSAGVAGVHAQHVEHIPGGGAGGAEGQYAPASAQHMFICLAGPGPHLKLMPTALTATSTSSEASFLPASTGRAARELRLPRG